MEKQLLDLYNRYLIELDEHNTNKRHYLEDYIDVSFQGFMRWLSVREENKDKKGSVGSEP